MPLDRLEYGVTGSSLAKIDGSPLLDESILLLLSRAAAILLLLSKAAPEEAVAERFTKRIVDVFAC